MRILHREKHFHFRSDELVDVARKIGKMATICKRLQDEASLITVDVEGRDTKKKNDQLKVGITVELPGKTLRAESRRFEVVEAIDRCVEKLEPQLRKYKELHSRLGIVKSLTRKKRKTIGDE